jgi:predicted amidophosphoribosyltransferase
MVDDLLVSYEFKGALRHAWLAVKYSGRGDAASAVGAGFVAMSRQVVSGSALVVPVPTTSERRFVRGFDQSVTLAEGLANASGRPVASILQRTSDNAQTGRGRLDRLHAPPSFRSKPCSGVVVLVDDVVTTGATLSSAAQAVRASGASNVVAVVLANTPMTRPPQSP